jgi:hypothetical protein
VLCARKTSKIFAVTRDDVLNMAIWRQGGLLRLSAAGVGRPNARPNGTLLKIIGVTASRVAAKSADRMNWDAAGVPTGQRGWISPIGPKPSCGVSM